jgi:hypothetical protein
MRMKRVDCGDVERESRVAVQYIDKQKKSEPVFPL